jgi:hypothetical protein
VTFAIAAATWYSAARTSGRWRSVSAGKLIASVSGAFGIGPTVASSAVSAAGGLPVSTANACRVCSIAS